MKTKNVKSTITLFVMCVCFSCSCSDWDVEDQTVRKAILGKWELIAEGATEDTIYDLSDGGLFWTDAEFRSDGTFVFLDSHTYPVGVIRSGTFKIYPDLLVSFFNGIKSSQKYYFSGDTLLYINDFDVPPIPEDLYVYSPRWFVYKRNN